MEFRSKVLALEDLPAWREALRKSGLKLVVTNGCFDVLHLGHASYLEAARQEGDVLLVGVNSDVTVRELKGPDRPVNPEADRAALVAALASVDAVCIFPELRATRLIARAQPDVYVKGGDYTVETIPPEERQAAEFAGAKIRFLPVVPGKSTTGLLQKLAGGDAGAAR